MGEMLSPNSIKRLYSGSLDADYSFENLELLTQYATTSPLAYSGQILYDSNTDTLYKVKKDKSGVEAVGSGSGTSIEVLEESEYTTYWDGLVINPTP